MSGNRAEPHFRILVADDEPLVSELIVAALSSYAVTTVDNGISAWNELSQGHYELALLDAYMPGMTGMEIAESCRAYGIRSRLILISADSDLAAEAKGKHKHFDATLSKPIRGEWLRQVVSDLVRLGTSAPGLNNLPSAALLNAEQWQQVTTVMGDEQLLTKLQDRFVSQLQDVLQQLQTKAQGQDVERILELAHKLEGTAGTLGAYRLAAACRTLRQEAHWVDRLPGLLARLQACVAELSAALQKIS